MTISLSLEEVRAQVADANKLARACIIAKDLPPDKPIFTEADRVGGRRNSRDLPDERLASD